MQTLTKSLQSRINRFAHRQALEYEKRTRAALLARLQNARDAGASFEVLSRLLDELEAAQPTA